MTTGNPNLSASSSGKTTELDINTLDRQELLYFLENAKSEVILLEKIIIEKETAETNLKNSYCVAKFLAVFLLLFISPTCDSLKKGLNPFASQATFVGIAISILMIVFAVVFFLSLWRKIKKKIKKCEKALGVSPTNFLKFLPTDYWSSYTCQVMIDSIRNGMAETWTQVVRRWKIHEELRAIRAAASSSSSSTCVDDDD